jgi:hypothetical protein
MDLIVTMDGATSEICPAFLVEEEGTASTFRRLMGVFGTHGLPLSLRSDLGTHHFHTPVDSGPVDRDNPTQVDRALAHLEVEHIAAYSPEARSPSERMFRTLRDRLVKELALASITTAEASERVHSQCLSPRSRPLRGEGRAGQFRLRRDRRRRVFERDPLHPGRPLGRQRQRDDVSSPPAANPAQPTAPALRQSPREGAPVC